MEMYGLANLFNNTLLIYFYLGYIKISIERMKDLVIISRIETLVLLYSKRRSSYASITCGRRCQAWKID